MFGVPGGVGATSEILGAKIACEGARHQQEPYAVPRRGLCCVNVKHVLGLGVFWVWGVWGGLGRIFVCLRKNGLLC